jgi:8-oxo-dGTP diphosphatase
MNYIIRPVKPAQVRPALLLAYNVFMEYEAPAYCEEGIKNFINDCIENEAFENNYTSGRFLMLGAFDNEKIIGMLAEKNGNHICLLFVDKEYHRQGVASALMREMVVALKLKGADRITVNSSPYGVPFYQNFGFTETGELQTVNGITFVPMVYIPNELWDAYDENRVKTGKIVERGHGKDVYHLVVSVWIRSSKGEYLISKRSPNKPDPLMWECTGGSAVMGEDSLTAAVREVGEELGVTLNPENGRLFTSIVRPWYPDILDVWLFEQDVDINTVVLQEGETCDAMWASKNTILKMIDEGTFFGRRIYPFIDDLFKKEG